MAKPPARRIPSDDLVIERDGEEYALHEGEWVEVVTGYTVGDLRDSKRWQKLLEDKEAIGDDETEALAEWEKQADTILEDLSHSIDSRLAAWSWTDVRGRPLPPPSPSVIRSLSWDEVGYLLRVVRGQTETDLKNGSAPSPTTTSATASRRRRS